MPKATSDPAVDLLHVILAYAKDADVALTQIRLVKFLYLADLFHARERNGRTITAWPWRFHHYGPYCEQSVDAIERSRAQPWLLTRAYRSSYSDDDFELFRHAGGKDVEAPRVDLLPLAARQALKDTIRRYGDNTNALLDYVYFSTEPMKRALPQDILDFSSAEPPRRVAVVPMATPAAKAKARARELLAELTKQFPRPSPQYVDEQNDAWADRSDADSPTDSAPHLQLRLAVPPQDDES